MNARINTMDKDQENNTSEKKRGRGAVEEEEADDGDKKRVKVDVVPAKKVELEVEVEEKPENVGPKCDCGIVPPREVAKKGKNKGRAYFSCHHCKYYAFEVRTASCF
jgi:hypothetical protein